MFEIQTLQVLAEGNTTLRVIESRERYEAFLIDLTASSFTLQGQTIKSNAARLVVATYLRLGKSFMIEANGVLYALDPAHEVRRTNQSWVRVATQVFLPPMSEYIRPPAPLPPRFFTIPVKYHSPSLHILAAANCEFHHDPRSQR